MKFNSFKQLSSVEAVYLREQIMRAFYARHPKVLNAVNYDGMSFGSLTDQTERMVREALDRDAGMQSALDNIAHGPLRTATAFREMARTTPQTAPSDGAIYAAVSKQETPEAERRELDAVIDVALFARGDE